MTNRDQLEQTLLTLRETEVDLENALGQVRDQIRELKKQLGIESKVRRRGTW